MSAEDSCGLCSAWNWEHDADVAEILAEACLLREVSGNLMSNLEVMGEWVTKGRDHAFLSLLQLPQALWPATSWLRCEKQKAAYSRA